jgi:hypothetical protein
MRKKKRRKKMTRRKKREERNHKDFVELISQLSLETSLEKSCKMNAQKTACEKQKRNYIFIFSLKFFSSVLSSL